jgi:leader peptidase (prepilin peptidase)/N-methyltransferase
MGIVEIVLACAAGLLVGSFLNVCIYRWPLDLTVRKPARSFCPKCEKTISGYDNIPVLSYVLLGGKCRACQARISWRYPAVELLTAALFGYSVWAHGLTGPALKLIIFSTMILALIVTDIEERILPDEFTVGGTLLGLVLSWFIPVEPFLSFLIVGESNPALSSLIDSAIGAVFAGGVVWFIRWMYEKIRHREGMGFGDVKMMAMIGAFLGLRLAFGTLFIGCVLGSVLGLAIMYFFKKGSDYELPFGSFLGVAALLEAFFPPV